MKAFFTKLFEMLFGKQTVDSIVGDVDRKIAQLWAHAHKHTALAAAAQEAANSSTDEAARASRIADRFTNLTN